MFGNSHILIYRLAHWFHKKHVLKIPDFLNGLNRHFNGIEIHPSAEIGTNLVIVHPVGIVIGGFCNIGKNVQIQQGVTLGYRRGPIPGDGHPIIEDDVVIGAGAKVLGPVTIGRGSVIGANSVVLVSVPPFALAVGVPARIIPSKYEGEHESWHDGIKGS
jgi:serine O-acetyltransferase